MKINWNFLDYLKHFLKMSQKKNRTHRNDETETFKYLFLKWKRGIISRTGESKRRQCWWATDAGRMMGPSLFLRSLSLTPARAHTPLPSPPLSLSLFSLLFYYLFFIAWHDGRTNGFLLFFYSQISIISTSFSMKN